MAHPLDIQEAELIGHRTSSHHTALVTHSHMSVCNGRAKPPKSAYFVIHTQPHVCMRVAVQHLKNLHTTLFTYSHSEYTMAVQKLLFSALLARSHSDNAMAPQNV